MLAARLVVALVGIPLLLGVTFLGGWWLNLLAELITLVGLMEFYHLAKRMQLKPMVPAGLLGGLFLIPVAYLSKGMPAWFLVVVTLGLLFLFLLMFPRLGVADLAVTFLGIWYVGGLVAYLPLIRLLPGGAGALTMVFLLTWATDSGAYFCGLLFGRRHPWPRLSPGKTWAGAIGGLFGSILIALAIGPLLLPGLSYWLLGVLAILVAVTAQAGDLIESGLKRQAGVKDSGWLLPGHGGILDRFDSLLLVAPVVYYYLVFFLS
ncbi:phosphatidate cytidylyltransferase [Neomoorella thermoacetica]|uniref:Phosphatidate cytidylyltransferase n=1 Tax=Moorella thermoacetica (strain ATCC 39073 / JCM 9320) TaxID=264732 RepID=Q2RJN6_MOOTA|nr:phosphatidate cytidylyltransferase [Moorella thermoacetica]AKX93800.1 phosphatidate cytidylyltransferase [Moorella thermoacetica]AKX96442.1 phosphatidate cytidylyltransferase [Moorella thermoacetica]OIQ56171.1 phosphatidate cytidylyltransferase [Moorella thermoacetica]OIQ57612.1 phosphatidate cytidylyltransferase [Moorella thermoacetica]QDA00256.1 Phosphatidate cytidylyltransferase [Moorella thermoacetica]